MDREELEHYTEVLLSMKEYEGFVWREAFRKKQHLKRLSEKHLRLLPDETQKANIAAMMRCAKTNQVFWDEICEMQKGYGPEVALPSHINFKEPLKTPYRHYSKLKSTLHQCVRDWAEEGAEEREQCYKPILDELKRVLPVNASNKYQQKVLVPGAGLGRLALEIVSMGYVTEGNEFSYQMLFTSNFILNCATEPQAFTLHPWIDNPCNVMRFEDFSRPVTIPDVAPASLLDAASSGHERTFSMCAGEFLEVYADDVDTWDCIVTCFFIDAAPNVIEYMEAIQRMLKPGGVWINLGPLLYHWANGDGDDDRYAQSIELTYEEVKHVAQGLNFTFTHEERRECLYTCNQPSMLRSVYQCVQFTAIKGAQTTSSSPAKAKK